MARNSRWPSRIFYKTKRTNHFGSLDGLPSNKIKGLLLDNKNNHLWISTDKGLSYLDLNNRKFTNFGLEAGIINREFNNMSYLCNQSGEFFFGSTNGIYHFIRNKSKRILMYPKSLLLVINFMITPPPKKE